MTGLYDKVAENQVVGAINQVFRQRLNCRTEEELAKTCLAVAEELTGSQFGFLGELNASGRLDTIALSDPGWGTCQVPESDATVMIRDMELRGIWSRVLRTGQSQIVNDPAGDPDRVGLPEGHPPLHAFLGVPLLQDGEAIGLIALGNREGGYTELLQAQVEGLSVAVMEVLRSKRTEDRLAQQTQEIMELSTPVMQIWEGMVVAPLIGSLDSQRTQQFMERLLDAVDRHGARVALVDITGVPTIDTQTAQHIIETMTAVKLLGARIILTGVRPAIAQTLVHLAIDLSDIDTRSSLSAGLRLGLSSLGLQVMPVEVEAAAGSVTTEPERETEGIW